MSTYLPYAITYTDGGRRVTWDRYATRRAAVRDLVDMVECFGLVDATIEFRGRWSPYESQDREIARASREGLVQTIAWTEHRLRDATGRARRAHLAYLDGARRRLATLTP